MKRCNQCIKYEILHTLCDKCKELNEFDALMTGDAIELPKIDLGQAVSPEEKQGLTDNALIHHGEKEEFKLRMHYTNPVLVEKMLMDKIYPCIN